MTCVVKVGYTRSRVNVTYDASSYVRDFDLNNFPSEAGLLKMIGFFNADFDRGLSFLHHPVCKPYVAMYELVPLTSCDDNVDDIATNVFMGEWIIMRSSFTVMILQLLAIAH